jgi:hypothetical protein
MFESSVVFRVLAASGARWKRAGDNKVKVVGQHGIEHLIRIRLEEELGTGRPVVVVMTCSGFLGNR